VQIITEVLQVRMHHYLQFHWLMITKSELMRAWILSRLRLKDKLNAGVKINVDKLS